MSGHLSEKELHFNCRTEHFEKLPAAPPAALAIPDKPETAKEKNKQKMNNKNLGLFVLFFLLLASLSLVGFHGHAVADAWQDLYANHLTANYLYTGNIISGDLRFSSNYVGINAGGDANTAATSGFSVAGGPAILQGMNWQPTVR